MGDAVFESSILLDPRPVEDGLTPLQWIARHTKDFSGSHLLEVCAQAAKRPVIEAIVKAEYDHLLHSYCHRTEQAFMHSYDRRDGNGRLTDSDSTGIACRSCSFEDFKEALSTVRPTLLLTERGETVNL